MTLKYEFSSKFKKDIKRLKKKGTQLDLIHDAIDKIINEKELGYEFKKHLLEPKSQVPKRWEIHLGGRNSDLLLIYYFPEQHYVYFERVGSHSDLF